jgi:hypothetical protein
VAVRTKITLQEMISKQRFLMPSGSQVSSVIYCDELGLRSSEEAGTVSTAARPPVKPSPLCALGRAGFFVSGRVV